MSYSEEEMREIERDPVRLRGYFWRVATNAHRMALENRAKSREMALYYPVTRYYEGPFFEGQDLLIKAKHLDSFSKAILDNIDALVDSSLVKEESNV